MYLGKTTAYQPTCVRLSLLQNCLNANFLQKMEEDTKNQISQCAKKDILFKKYQRLVL